MGGASSSHFLHENWQPDPALYYYADPAHIHAVTSVSGLGTFTYDANGNMTLRVEGGTTYTQTFNVENRLVSVTVGSSPQPLTITTPTGRWSRALRPTARSRSTWASWNTN